MKMISANKLNRLWKNGVVAKMIAKTKVLKTMEEISANTSAENVAGATAVKELSNKLGGYSFGVTSDGKPGYRKPGADTVTPFNDIQVKSGSFSIQAGKSCTIDLGGKPKFLILVADTTYKVPCIYSSQLGHMYALMGTDNNCLQISDTGFTYKQTSNWGSGTCYYCYSMTKDILFAQ